MVVEAVEALGGSTTNAAVRQWVWDRYPGTNRSTINCQIVAGTVNHPSRVHYAIDARPRPANNSELDRFFRPEKGRIELYDPPQHGKWEIYETQEGRMSVRQVDEWADVVVSGRRGGSGTGAEKRGGGEVAWAAWVQSQLEPALQSLSFGGVRVRVDTGYRLPYAYEVLTYKEEAPQERRVARYQTDLLIFDDLGELSEWVPRVVIECKIKGVTTHDALTYSGKAATHKQVHPYLRYGMLIGSYGTCVPARLVRHGAYFDFMAVWEAADPNQPEWEELVNVLMDEVRASRALQQLLSGSGKTRPFRILHRPLRFRGT